MTIDNIQYIFFIMFFIIFLFEDIKQHSVHNIIFNLYLFLGFMLCAIKIYISWTTTYYIDINFIIDKISSILIGLIILMISIFSNESIGRGDAIYFIINGFYLSCIENILLFIFGIFVSFIISIFLYIKNKGNMKNVLIPFIPCLLPSILWRLVCIL